MTTGDAHQLWGNVILDALPEAEFTTIRDSLKSVELQQGDVLVAAREPITQVYFPVSCTVCWVNSTSEGDRVDVAIAGFEGLVGTTLLLGQNVAPWEARIQLTGTAWQLEAGRFIDALSQCSVLHQKVSAFTHFKMMQLTQSAVCNCFHAVEQRLCRCLLAVQDRVGTAELLLSRDCLARMIGSPRPPINIVMGTLQSAGLIHMGRGKITILNREEMEQSACECYLVLKQHYDRYLE